MAVSVHLTFGGTCEAAFRFYERCLAGTFATKLYLLKYADTPVAAQTPPEWRDKIVHATLAIDGARLAGADVRPEAYTPPKGFYVLVDVADVAAAERVFAALADGGTVEMPLAETFWARRFGVLVDRFGTPWEINCGGGR